MDLTQIWLRQGATFLCVFARFLRASGQTVVFVGRIIYKLLHELNNVINIILFNIIILTDHFDPIEPMIS
jgi:hypothetical protein